MTLQEHTRSINLIRGLGDIADHYDALFCDIWGVLHNGVESFSAASEALGAFRRKGGVVVLITNAPRPADPIRRQLLKLGVSIDAFDAIATSGDVAIDLIDERIEDPVLHIGPARDLSLLEGAAEVAGRPPQLVGLEAARYALCTGLRDDRKETPDDYEDELQEMIARGMEMICANPDIVIHRGDALVYCAGALAQRYEELGGSVVYSGKPHAPIYRRALALAEKARGRPISAARVLAIGDGMNTDIRGATATNLDCLLVTHGIHRATLHGENLASPLNQAALLRLCAEYCLWPKAAIETLRP